MCEYCGFVKDDPTQKVIWAPVFFTKENGDGTHSLSCHNGLNDEYAEMIIPSEMLLKYWDEVEICIGEIAIEFLEGGRRLAFQGRALNMLKEMAERIEKKHRVREN